jgi:hypothetical protein
MLACVACVVGNCWLEAVRRQLGRLASRRTRSMVAPGVVPAPISQTFDDSPTWVETVVSTGI